MYKRTIGENIAYYRRKKDISQKDFANLIGMAPANVSRIEKNIANPRAETLEKILNALQITPNQLFGVEQYENVHVLIPFARNIKNIREDKNLSTSKMASLLEVSEFDVISMEKGTLVPSKNLLKKISDTFMISEEFLTENNLYKRNKSEITILESIKNCNELISHIYDILNSDKYEEFEMQDPETGEIITKVLDSNYFAKQDILKALQALSLNELIDIYKNYTIKNIVESSSALEVRWNY